MDRMKLGFLPTRRSVFSKQEAQIQKRKIRNAISEFDIDIVDLEDLNEEGLLYDSYEMTEKAIAKFITSRVDAVFIPHCNFGTEDSVARVAKAVSKPVLLWGPRDEAPTEDGDIQRFTLTGIFATSKVLRRYRVKFTYLQNCRLGDEEFKLGFENFIKSANIVKQLKNTRILQIGTRTAPFLSVISNEGELLEKFGVEVLPINLKDIEVTLFSLLENNQEQIEAEAALLENKLDMSHIETDAAKKIIALKLALRQTCEQNKCNTVVIQCWSTLQKMIGIMPCMSIGLLTDEGLNVMCETDIHGAIGSVIAKAATMGKTAPFLADFGIRHPENDNGELLWHCGNFPPSLAKADSQLKGSCLAEFENSPAGTSEGELKSGKLSIIRFDGDNGQYRLFMGKAKTIAGPLTWGSYLWVEVNDWPLWEEVLVKGPYIHHCVCIYEDIIIPIYNALEYLEEIKLDLVDPTECELRKIIRESRRGVL